MVRPSGRARVGLALLALLALPGALGGPPRHPAPLTLVPVTARDVLSLARRPGAAATLVNVWASWCVPCRQELPELLRLARDYRGRGLRLALVSADFDSAAARACLVGLGVNGANFLKAEDDMPFIATLEPRWSGGLPATFVYDRAGRLVSFWEGRSDYARFEQAVRQAMDRGSGPKTREKT